MRSRTGVGRSSPATNESVEILSNEEQQKVIDELKGEAATQSNIFRQIFSILFLVIAGLFCFCFGYSFNQPWALHHQIAFKDLVTHETFLAYYCLSAYCFVIASLLVRVSSSIVHLYL